MGRILYTTWKELLIIQKHVLIAKLKSTFYAITIKNPREVGEILRALKLYSRLAIFLLTYIYFYIFHYIFNYSQKILNSSRDNHYFSPASIPNWDDRRNLFVTFFYRSLILVSLFNNSKHFENCFCRRLAMVCQKIDWSKY